MHDSLVDCALVFLSEFCSCFGHCCLNKYLLPSSCLLPWIGCIFQQELIVLSVCLISINANFFNQTNIQSKFKDILIQVNGDNQEYLSSSINNITLLIATYMYNVIYFKSHCMITLTCIKRYFSIFSIIIGITTGNRF